MIRKIVHIDEEKCTGCGLCAAACHEAAIQMVAGKARLVKDDYCDGLGDCLPACPAEAIQIIEREAVAYDHEAVQSRIAAKKMDMGGKTAAPGVELGFSGCPGSRVRILAGNAIAAATQPATSAARESQLRTWPVQIQLAPIQAPYFDGAKLLLAADCTAYAYADFHEEFIRGHVVLIGCPKLDAVDYSEKLTAILERNDIRSMQIVRMEVPCCGGLEHAAKQALQTSGKMIPWQVVTISCEGKKLESL